MAARHLIALVVTIVLVSTANPAAASAALTADQKARAERLTALFESGIPEVQYGSVEALGDGRGITAGRAGFTSATGDLLEVVERYTARVPHNRLARYLPRLRQLAKEGSGSTRGLRGFARAWGAAASDVAMHRVQDAVVDEDDYAPAMRHADHLGLTLPLSRAALYDAAIQHGVGDDPDGLPALIRRAGAGPADGVDERTWLRAFLRVRRRDLAHAHDPATRAVWAESVGRVDVLRALLNAGEVDLDTPLRVHTGGFDALVP